MILIERLISFFYDCNPTLTQRINLDGKKSIYPTTGTAAAAAATTTVTSYICMVLTINYLKLWSRNNCEKRTVIGMNKMLLLRNKLQCAYYRL
jgi:hypothetical protein